MCFKMKTYLHMEEFQAYLESIEAPLVLVDRLISNVKKRQVVSDNKLGGYIATKFLLEKKYTTSCCSNRRKEFFYF